jgi:uncharacterized protein with von Willebrand factor type A (vWA) domain
MLLGLKRGGGKKRGECESKNFFHGLPLSQTQLNRPEVNSNHVNCITSGGPDAFSEDADGVHLLLIAMLAWIA